MLTIITHDESICTLTNPNFNIFFYLARMLVCYYSHPL